MNDDRKPRQGLSDEWPRLSVMFGRTMRKRCPNCGGGPLFRAFLKPIERCEVCGEPYGHIRTDDAAPWLTIVLVGHIVVPLLLAVERTVLWPVWISMTLWPMLALALTLLLLPYTKALLLGIIWRTRAQGSEIE